MRPREAPRELRYIRYQSINQIRSDSNGELSVQIRFGSQSDLIDLTAALTLANKADLTNYLATASSGPPYHFPSAGCTIITYMEFGPNPEQEDGFWHRTQTVDYIVILEGELELSLDGGEERIIKRGDIIIQRVAMYKWKNPSKTTSAKFVGILLGAEGAVEDGVEYGGE
jgi:hypothetical protein